LEATPLSNMAIDETTGVYIVGQKDPLSKLTVEMDVHPDAFI